MLGDENLCTINFDVSGYLPRRRPEKWNYWAGHSVFLLVALLRLTPTLLWLQKDVEHRTEVATLTWRSLYPGDGDACVRIRSSCSDLSNALQVANRRLLLKQILSAHITLVRGT